MGWPPVDGEEPDPRKRAVRSHSIVLAVAKPLLQACRVHGVTVTALLTAVVASVLGQEMVENKEKDATLQRVAVACSARRHMPDPNVFGSFVYVPSIESLEVGPSRDAWELAQTILPRLKEFAKKECIVERVQRLSRIDHTALKQAARSPALQGRIGAFCLSNIGVVEQGNGTIRLDQLFSVTNAAAMGQYLIVNGCTVGDNVFVTIGSAAPVVAPERSRRVAKEIERLVSQACCGVDS